MGHILTDEERWKGGRPLRKACITVRGIAQLTGRSIQTIRNDIVKKKLEFPSGKGDSVTGEEVLSIAKYLKKYGISK